MSSPDWKANAFVADSQGPPRRRLYITQDPPLSWWGRLFFGASGWEFAVSDVDMFDEEAPVFDMWAETFDEILLYPVEYAPRDIVWRRRVDGEVVDLYKLKVEGAPQ